MTVQQYYLLSINRNTTKGFEFVACSRFKRIDDLKITGISWERF